MRRGKRVVADRHGGASERQDSLGILGPSGVGT